MLLLRNDGVRHCVDVEKTLEIIQMNEGDGGFELIEDKSRNMTLLCLEWKVVVAAMEGGGYNKTGRDS